jgi:hypothetical protein
MRLIELLREYWAIKKKSPSYRLGQHLIIRLGITQENEPKGMWDGGDANAITELEKLVERYQWDWKDLPIKRI